MKEVLTKGAEETLRLGERIGAGLRANDVIALIGELGTGKTTLIQGMAEGVGVSDYVTSPTFIIINEYQACLPDRQGRLPFFHVDLYRLNYIKDIEALGIEEYFDRGGVCVIEWAEKLGGLLPKAAEKIELEMVSENERKICISSGLAARLK